MSAHTPGPWNVWPWENESVARLCVGPGDAGIAVCTFFDGDLEELPNAEANARLIASAPIGYDLAKSVFAWWEQHQWDTQPCGDGDSQNTYDDEPEFVELAKQFIAKAEGKS